MSIKGISIKHGWSVVQLAVSGTREEEDAVAMKGTAGCDGTSGQHREQGMETRQRAAEMVCKVQNTMKANILEKSMKPK